LVSVPTTSAATPRLKYLAATTVATRPPTCEVISKIAIGSGRRWRRSAQMRIEVSP
jgi:hypothetical protein